MPYDRGGDIHGVSHTTKGEALRHVQLVYEGTVEVHH